MLDLNILTWDLARSRYNRDGTLSELDTSIWIADSDEVVQRVRTRLLRVLGEYFLHFHLGLPWLNTHLDTLGALNNENTRTIIIANLMETTVTTKGVDSVEDIKFTISNRTASAQIKFWVDGTLQSLDLIKEMK